MKISDQIIEVMEYLSQKIGVTIDWGSENILPILQELCMKFTSWEIATSIVWIIIAVIVFGITVCIHKKHNLLALFHIVLAIGLVIVFCQIFDIVECYTFPEKVIYDYISKMSLNS